MESNEEPEMYVCDPVYTKEGVKGCTHYKLKGNRITETLNRRYKISREMARNFYS